MRNPAPQNIELWTRTVIVSTGDDIFQRLTEISNCLKASVQLTDIGVIQVSLGEVQSHITSNTGPYNIIHTPAHVSLLEMCETMFFYPRENYFRVYSEYSFLDLFNRRVLLLVFLSFEFCFD